MERDWRDGQETERQDSSKLEEILERQCERHRDRIVTERDRDTKYLEEGLKNGVKVRETGQLKEKTGKME